MKIPGTIVILMLSFSAVQGQNNLQQAVEKYSSSRTKDLKTFYQFTTYQFCWINNRDNLSHLISTLKQSEAFALNVQDYSIEQVEEIQTKTLATQKDSVEAEIKITDVALHFFTELKNGNTKPSFRYEGLAYKPKSEEVPILLAQYIQSNRFNELTDIIQLRSGEYRNAMIKLQWFLNLLKDENFSEVKIVLSALSNTNTSLLKKLAQFGIIETGYVFKSEKDISQKIIQVQKILDLPQDGYLKKQTINALNVPISQRVKALKTFINYLRWLEDIKQNGTVLILNLPSANFMVYEQGKTFLQSKIIAGKQSTPTPTLTSTITQVILYPYWMVPNKIATQELLPAIKRDVGYIDRYNYQVLNKQGRILNPYSINWHSLSSGYFPYIIRQCTGCDNALGIVKFNFYNPFTVYLHDTPTKPLFSYNKRFFSHGCMRVEKPVELARLLLGYNRIAIDTLTEKGCLQHKSPVTLPAQNQLPIIVLYSTVWYNADAEIIFYDDIYKAFNAYSK
jgi:murein L,D-transpeptidase YcbB/YkuD